ncbi:MAG: YifB family Mg chelatase-like AAA ATPase [Patescibacteria group bacterium]|nr:YifB family Mg chelatase-like AAA ATPase [Patescibacteria group bacterium]
MALAKIKSGAAIGLEAVPIEVEVDISNGLPGITIVGLPDKAVEEAKERIRSAIKNSGIILPSKRITINLAPADLRKAGPAYDLPMAIGILLASEQIKLSQNAYFYGELALNGDLRPIQGSILFATLAAKDEKATIYLPSSNAIEASLISNITIIPINSLSELVEHLRGEKNISPHPHTQIDSSLLEQTHGIDMADVAGQEHAKRALEIAATGRHHVIMSGSPGSGKTMLAKAFSTILPPLSTTEMLEVTKLYSISGLLNDKNSLMLKRPFRKPHHTASAVAITGGGNWPKPGEISLAHHGVLFLDELPEFPRQVLDVLRQPIEDKQVHISRAATNVTFPANFSLVAAQNPCPCGFYGDKEKTCTCTAGQIQNYQKKVSGPLLDRIDLQIQVLRLPYEKFIEKEVSAPSSEIRLRVIAAFNKQQQRFENSKTNYNSEMNTDEIKQFCNLDETGHKLLQQAMEKFHLSGRAYSRTLKVARTIADLAESIDIKPEHLAESLSYRIGEN